MFDHYQPTFQGVVMELGVYVLACVAALHARSQRANWQYTLFLGMLAGLVLEVLIVRDSRNAEALGKIYYEYGTKQFLVSLVDVPVCVGVGWGIVLYASTWTAHRLNLAWLHRAMVAGALAVNIDLTLDPVAHALEFWVWKGLDHNKEHPILNYYGVPFDNYVAWFGIVALFSLCARGGFRTLDRWFPRAESGYLKNWSNLVVPLLALLLSGGAFWLVRLFVIDHVYALLDAAGGGQAVLFLGLFILTAYFLWLHNLASRRDMAIHWPILAVPIFFHVICMFLLLTKGIKTQPTLLVLIPMTAVVGFFSYVWPSIDTFLNNSHTRMRDRQRRALMRLLEQLTPETLAVEKRELDDPNIPVAKKRSLAVHSVAGLIHALQDPDAGPRHAAGEPHEVYQHQVEAITTVLYGASAALTKGPGHGGRLERLADDLMKAADQAARDTDVETTTLFSYGGDSVEAKVHRPKTRGQLARLLPQLGKNKTLITFRAGGNAFDTQSLNKVVISLDRFDDIRVDVDNARVTVGSGATWGDILKETLKHNLVPYVMVTTRTTTAGGTLSADSLSRFSPTCGKEGLHVASFVLMKLDGTEVVCSRTQHRDLFRAAIAGLGYVGAVVEVTYELLRVPFDATKIAVSTEFRTCPLKDVAKELVAGVDRTQRCVVRDNDQLVCTPSNPFEDLKALSAVIYLRGEGQGLLAESKYIKAEKSEWKRSPFHNPFSIQHLLLQIAAHIPGARAIAYFFIFKVLFKKPDHFIDEIFGYTFFEDGNRVLRYWGRKLCLPMGIRQQTFVVRWDPRDVSGSQATLKQFLDQGEDLMKKLKLSPALIDVLYVPDDGSDDFLLTSNYDLAGFAVTYTFEKVFSKKFPEVEAFFRELSKVVRKEPFHGRVHLVKNVHADVKLLEEMYRPRLVEMATIRRREGVTDLLQNDFMQRVLPSLTNSPKPGPNPVVADGAGE